MTPPEEFGGPPPDDDVWAGMVDENGYPIEPDDVYGGDTAPHVVSETPGGMTEQEAVAARYRLPEEFWGARELFKAVRQAAWSSQTHPDAVKAATRLMRLPSHLCEPSGAVNMDVFRDGLSLRSEERRVGKEC